MWGVQAGVSAVPAWWIQTFLSWEIFHSQNSQQHRSVFPAQDLTQSQDSIAVMPQCGTWDTQRRGVLNQKASWNTFFQKQIIWKHWIHASHCHSLVLSKLFLHNATHRLLVQIQSKSFLQATLSSVALYTYIHSVPYVSELCWENSAFFQFPEFECWHT